MAQLAYDVTVRFCDRYSGKRSRTHDQMVQAARSGVQNIAEGSQASGTSKKTELKLTNVARASLEELRLDYQDFLRQRGLPIRDRRDPRRALLVNKRCQSADEVARWVMEVGGRNGLCGHGLHGPDGPHGPNGLSQGSRCPAPTGSTGSTGAGYAEVAANAALTLIAVACSLLDRQLAARAAAFERTGGFTERLYQSRSESRKKT